MEKNMEEEKERLKQFNRISIMDFEIESSTLNLKEMELIINRLIKKHKSFVKLRKKELNNDSMNMFG
tara:strand:+ start:321 stop:521 length:201 start_codon:yes stop_codon:yes gene_type:complete